MAKILIVEDHNDLREFFKVLLEMNHFEIKCASSGAEVNDLLTSFIPDLILLDVMLQNEDGRELCKQIKTIHKEIFIVLISANPRLLANYEDCDADGVIEKPFSINDIIAKVKLTLAKKAVTF